MTARRFAVLAGALIAVALAVLVALNLPAGLDLSARAAEVTGHEQRLDELAGDLEGLQARIDEARTDLSARKEENGAAEARIGKQERRLERLRERIAALEG